jgi:hypothetical protein
MPAVPMGRRPPTLLLPSPRWTPEQESALAELVRVDEARRVWIGSLEITELLRRQLIRGISSMESAVTGPGLPGGPGAATGLQPISSLGGPSGGPDSAPRGFRFEVNTELVVYGATEPDAKVHIAGRPVRLRPDGSFAFRFALPDGDFELPIVATSADAVEQRSARLSFRRNSAYSGHVGSHPQDPALRPPAPENVD